MPQGFVVWLTGLPCSGKTTLANALASTLHDRGYRVEVLDGDELRRTISADLGFSARDRREHARRVVALSKQLIADGVVALVPLISPYHSTREHARRELQRFVEVYVKAPLEECIKRDVKGLYARAIRGEITEFTGISDPYEEPDSPEVTVETHLLTEEQCTKRILGCITALSYLGPSLSSDGVGPSAGRSLERQTE